MLTKDEQKWLNDREIFLAGLGCYVWDGYYWDEGSPFEDMKEAAEFEGRVAAKLANPKWAVCWNSDSCLEFGGSKDEPRWWWDCEWCRLKHARLQVEEEMNGKVCRMDTARRESEIDRIHNKVVDAMWEQIMERVRNDTVFRELWYSKKIRVDFKLTKKGYCVSFKPCVVWEEDDADR